MDLMTPVQARQMALFELLKQRKAIATLKRNGCIELPIDPQFLATRAKLVIEGMRSVTEHARLRALFPWHTHKTDAYGEMYKQEAGLKHDTNSGENKFVFQFIRGAQYALGTMGSDGCSTMQALSAHGLFLRALSDIETMARDIALTIASYMDRAYGKSRPYSGSLHERLSRGTIVLRILRYLEVAQGAHDAIPHIDRGVITLHLYATHEGLWVVLPNGEKIRIRECEHDTTCAFFGRKYMAATQSATAGTPHGVKYERAGRGDRFSIVAFIHPEALDDDVAWLLANDAAVKAYEQRILL